MYRFALSLVLVLVLALAIAPAAVAQPAHQVADLNTTQEDYTAPLFTGVDFAVLGTDVFFLQDDGIHGVELWKTDGTAAGTVLLKDICPGACWGYPRALTVAGGVLYFAADDGVHGFEPWRSDGTAAGTTMIVDLNPGLPESQPRFLEAGGILYMTADDGVHGRELWKTDGTAAGTQMVADIRPGAAGSEPRLWLDVSNGSNGKLLLNADDGVHGREPWLTDGTAAGTALLADVNPGAGDSSLILPLVNLENDALALGGGSFLFQADDGVHGFEPWKSDGTPAGTALFVDINPGSGSSYAHGFTPLGSQILFAAFQDATGTELWATDGTPAGTALVKDIVTGILGGGVRTLTALGSRAYFFVFNAGPVLELWSTDGTAAGTVLVKTINPGPDFGFLFVRSVLVPFNGGLLFFGEEQAHGAELWQTDGTAAGTAMVKDIDPGAGWGVSQGFSGITVAGAAAYFHGTTAAHGTEIWKTDGSAAGTVEIRNLQTVTSSFRIYGDSPEGNFRSFGSKLLCEASDGVSGFEPWVSDGTGGGTVQLADLAAGAESGAPVTLLPVGGTHLLVGQDGAIWTTDGTPAGTSPLLPASTVRMGGSAGPALGQVFFAGEDSGSDVELWKTDGTAPGTVRVYDINPGSNSSNPAGFIPLGAAVLFTASDASGRELWRTAGTGATTYALTASTVTNIGALTPLGSVVLFTATVPGSGQELCATDGTPAGTILLKEIRAGAASSNPQLLGRLGGVEVFSADDDTHGRELWATDGTPAGTVLLQDIAPGAASSLVDGYPPGFSGNQQAVIGGTLFFVADDGVHGRELWKTDGTAPGTALVEDIFPGARSADVDWMTAAGGRLFFVADDGVHGRELWVSDGTAAGTRLVKDALPGAGSPVIRNPQAVGHLVLYSADDGVHGRELWRSDGGAAGTFQVQDIAPGTAPSNPVGFTEAGGNVFFAANDNMAGNELWAASKAALFVTFQDVPVDFWAWSYIEALAAAGLTTGCAPGQYCPGSLVTRAEIAAFLERGLHGPEFVPPAATGTVFTDVPADFWAAGWIEQLAADHITTGCAPNQFCPSLPVNRAEMAVFLLRARHGGAYMPPPVASTRFTDVPADFWAAAWIEQLAVEGITTGCAPNLYCPGDSVGRDQMAAFLARTFNLPLPLP